MGCRRPLPRACGRGGPSVCNPSGIFLWLLFLGRQCPCGYGLSSTCDAASSLASQPIQSCLPHPLKDLSLPTIQAQQGKATAPRGAPGPLSNPFSTLKPQGCCQNSSDHIQHTRARIHRHTHMHTPTQNHFIFSRRISLNCSGGPRTGPPPSPLPPSSQLPCPHLPSHLEGFTHLRPLSEHTPPVTSPHGHWPSPAGHPVTENSSCV